MSRTADFLNAIWNSFEKTAANFGGYRDRFYQIGGFHIRLRFADAKLLPLVTPSFAHLEIPAVEAPELTVHLGAGDSHSMPQVPWRKDDGNGRGNLWGFRYGESLFTSQLTADAYHILDRTRNVAYYWAHCRENFQRLEGGSPLLPIFHWWMSDHGRQLAHAAAVGTFEGGALLVGRGGAGKSNTALACLDAGLDYVADDYCLLENSHVPFVHSLYCSGKLNIDDVDRFPALRSCLSRSGLIESGRAIYFLHDGFAQKTVKGFPLKAILVLQLAAGGQTIYKKALSGKSFFALAPSTLFQLPGGAADSFKKLAELVRRLPCFTLQIGPDAAKIARIIRDLLAEL